MMIGNEWFQEHWQNKVTPEFELWWIGMYGFPAEYDPREEEQNEYWIRCVFALKGWLAAKGVSGVPGGGL